MRKLILLALLLGLPVLMGVGLGPGLFDGGGGGVWIEVAGPAQYIDADGDGRAEKLIGMADFDGDGSIVETCTAINVPLPQCKWIGQKIYPDYVDDYNCGLHGGRGTSSCSNTLGPGGAELWIAGGHEIQLEPIDYVVFPCWDVGNSGASHPGSWFDDPNTPGAAPSDADINDPREGEHTRHDQVSDGSYQACATDENNVKMYAAGNRMVSGVLRGAGRDQRRSDQDTITAAGASWDHEGTRLMVDMGNGCCDGTETVQWYGQDGFIRGTAFRAGCSAPAGAQTFADGLDCTDSYGYYAGGTVEIYDSAGEYCFCNNSGSCTGGGISSNDLDDLEAGDLVTINGAPHDSVGGSVHVMARVREDVVDGSCDSGNGVTVKLGRDVGGTNGRTNASQFEQFTTGQNLRLVKPDPKYWGTEYLVEGITFEAQDGYQEPGGECTMTGSGVWHVGHAEVGTIHHCDTTPFIGFLGSTSTYKDIGIKYWGHFAIDGGGVPLRAYLDDVRWDYGNGMSILDPGYQWEGRRLAVRDSRFKDFVSASFGMGEVWEDMTIESSFFQYIQHFHLANRNMRYRNITVKSSAFENIFSFECGAEGNSIENVFVTGVFDAQAGSGVSSFAHMRCDDSSRPIARNQFRNIFWDGRPPKYLFYMAGVQTPDTPWAGELLGGAIVNNVFDNIHVSSPAGTGSGHRSVLALFDIDSVGSHGDTGLIMNNVWSNVGTGLSAAENGHWSQTCTNEWTCSVPYDEDPFTQYGAGSYYTGTGNYVGSDAARVAAPHFAATPRAMQWSEEFYVEDLSGYTNERSCAKQQKAIYIEDIECYSGNDTDDFNLSIMDAPNDGTPTSVCTADVNGDVEGKTCTSSSTIANTDVAAGEWLCLDAVTGSATFGGCTATGYVK